MNARLIDVYPELVKEWSSENLLDIQKITTGSSRKAIWHGSCGHEWEAVIKNRVQGSGCPYCSGNKLLKGFNDFESNYPEIAKTWSERNHPLKSSDVLRRCNKSVWWICEKGHEWKARIADRAEGHGCPYCAGAILHGFNDLTTTYPEILSEWSEKNTINPENISALSLELVWWKCKECGYEWQARVATKVNGTECPNCRHQKTLKHYREMLDRRTMERRLAHDMALRCFLYYADKEGISYLRDDLSLFGIPVQIFIPDRRLVIEFHTKIDESEKSIRKAKVINSLALNKQIRVIRLLDIGCRSYDNCLSISRTDNTKESLSEALMLIFRYIGITIDIDINKDLTKMI